MSNETYQFGKDDSDGVARAVSVASSFVNAVKGNGDAGSVEGAVQAVARKSRIGEAFVLRLIQPSRRPKSVKQGVCDRLVGAYLRYLRLQHRDLALRIIRVEAMARNDRDAIRNLLDEAEALKDRIKALL